LRTAKSCSRRWRCTPTTSPAAPASLTGVPSSSLWRSAGPSESHDGRQTAPPFTTTSSGSVLRRGLLLRRSPLPVSSTRSSRACPRRPAGESESELLTNCMFRNPWLSICLSRHTAHQYTYIRCCWSPQVQAGLRAPVHAALRRTVRRHVPPCVSSILR
jgi:hypothetical protein